MIAVAVRHDAEAMRRRDGAVAADAIQYLGDKRQRLQGRERTVGAKPGDDECVSEVEEDRDRITHDHQCLVASRLTGYNASVAVVEPTRRPNEAS